MSALAGDEMRVLLITGSFPPMHCGVGDYTYGLARALSVAGIKVGVLTSREGAAPECNDIDLFPVVDAWRLREYPRIRRLLKRWQPDIVHIQYPTLGYGRAHLPTMLPALCSLTGFRVVQTWHESRRSLTSGALLWLLCQLPVDGGVVVVRPQLEEMMPRVLRHAFRRKVRRFIPNSSALPRVQLTDSERRTIREKWGGAGAQVVVYFGFVYAEKGVDQLFDLADPRRHHLVIIGERPSGNYDGYYESIVRQAGSERWLGRATLTGFLPAEEAARVISASDAVVLPFVSGGGEWNTSIHSAQAQGTFVLTTSTGRRGYDAEKNTYFALPGNIDEMRSALLQYIGRKGSGEADGMQRAWHPIADAHIQLYRKLLERTTVQSYAAKAT
jgi:glycosyltransferase involved in cell wall biosynthesis